MLALTHVPSPHLEDGLRTHVASVPIDYESALLQHADYVRLLGECGAVVRTLTVNRELADGVFIEDSAIVLDEIAVLTTMGTSARRPELPGIESELRKYREVYSLALPARLEGGDVLCVGRLLLVGLSARTDIAGAQALETIVKPHGYRVKTVPVSRCLHLKTACTVLPDGVLLVNPDWVDVQALAGFERIDIPDTEPWGANVLCVRGRVCAAAEHVQTAELLRRRGHDVRTVPLSEFAKAEGGVTCLSLLFD
jgi:dimethylargininase